MTLQEWLDATSPQGNLTPGERARRRLERRNAIKAAGTSITSLRIAAHRGAIGLNLALRLEKATKGTRAEFKALKQLPELTAADIDRYKAEQRRKRAA